MNSFVKYFLLAVLLFAPAAAFATTDVSMPEAPKVGDAIQISVNGYTIQAKITSVTSPAPAATTTTSTAPETTTQPAPAQTTPTQPTENPPLLPADIQQGLDNFANSNPIKSGIEALDNAIVAQAAKWLHLDLSGKQDGKVADNNTKDISQWSAGLMNAVAPYVKDIRSYWWLAIAIIFLTILFLLWKGKKKYDREY